MLKNSKRFTLVELLVVIAIIAILASMLLPALTQARYSARNVVCISNLKQVAVAALADASDSDGLFPTRSLAKPHNQYYIAGGSWVTPETISDTVNDDRDLFRRLSLDEASCPFSIPLSSYIDNTPTEMVSSYYYLFGWSLRSSDNSISTFSRPAKPVTYNGDEFDVIAGDVSLSLTNNGWEYSSHPDIGTGLTSEPDLNRTSQWQQPFWRSMSGSRGPVSMNFVRVDGSASSYKRVSSNDTRFKKLPYKLNSWWYTSRWRLIPSVE